jgi:hypothetical protein
LLQGPLRQPELERGGYVQVVNGGRCSNVVPVTHWEIPIQAVLSIDELTLTTTITVRMRADVHGWRLEPDAYARNSIPQGFLAASVHSRPTSPPAAHQPLRRQHPHAHHDHLERQRRHGQQIGVPRQLQWHRPGTHER